jgi:hypothetical protein
VPPQGSPDGSRQRGHSQEEVGKLGAQPLSRVLELAASKAADRTHGLCLCRSSWTTEGSRERTRLR